jgi:hypothetical protein
MQSLSPKENIMKYINLRLTLLPCIFVSCLFTSQQVLASQKDFVLTTPDSNEIGQGKYEELPDSIAQLVITIENREYSGTANITKILKKNVKGVRADRAMMAAKHTKGITAELVAADGTMLTCKLNIKHDDIWGQCIHSSNQQILTVKTIKEKAK